MHITLLLALLALGAWIILGILMPVGIGAIHLLLAVGTTLLVRWWGETQ